MVDGVFSIGTTPTPDAISVQQFYPTPPVTCALSCIFAPNTSTILISVLAAHGRPQRRPNIIGTHYSSPVSRMALVEVIPAFDTAPEAVEMTPGG